MDSLFKVLKTAKEDTDKVNTLNKLAGFYKSNDPDTGIILNRQAETLSKKLGWKKGIANSLSDLGTDHRMLGNYDSALYYLNLGMEIHKSINNKRGVSVCLGSIAVVYTELSNYPKALEFALMGIRLDEETGNKMALAMKLGNTGIIYMDMRDTKKALEYYERALAINKELNNKKNMAINLITIANVYKNARNYDKALEYCNEAYRLNEEIGDKYGIASSLGCLGTIYSDKGDMAIDSGKPQTVLNEYYSKALFYNKELYEIAAAINNKRYIVLSLENMAAAYGSLKQFKEAEKYFLEALKAAEEINALSIQKNLNEKLSTFYQQQNRSQLALKHYKASVALGDSITNEENTKKTVRLEMQFDFDKKEAAAKLEQEKKEAVAAAESKKQRIIIWSVSGILLLVIAFAVFAYRSYLQKQKANIEITKQKEIIEEKQHEILDSIHYAKRIQTALLPTEKFIERNLNDLTK